MFWRQLSQRICAMQDPDLRAPGTHPILTRRFVMNQQIRLKGLNKIEGLPFTQLGMDRSSGELKWSTFASREDMRVPEVGFARTPQVEHALSAADGKVPRHVMDQSWMIVWRL